MLLEAAHTIERVEVLKGHGLTGDCRIDWSALIARKHTFTDPVTEGSEGWLGGIGVELLHGDAVVTGDGEVSVGERSLTADHVVLATGARPRPMNVPGEELVTTSDKFMDLSELPDRVIFVGGGYVSFEFAGLVRRVGREVTILHRSAQVLKGFDTDLADLLVERYRALGIEVVTEAPVLGIRQDGSGLVVETSGGEYEAGLVVHGAGRVPNVDGMGLEAAGVEFGNRGVVVDEHLRSVSNPRFYAAGDAAALGMPLTPVASAQGRVVAANILGEEASFDGRATASVMFSDPPLASVGMGADEALKLGDEVSVTYNDTSGWFTQKRLGQTHAAAKVITDSGTGRVLGAHLLGPNSEEVINVFALAIRHGLTSAQVGETLWSYPTAASDIAYLL